MANYPLEEQCYMKVCTNKAQVTISYFGQPVKVCPKHQSNDGTKTDRPSREETHQNTMTTTTNTTGRYQVRQTDGGDWYIDGGLLPRPIPINTHKAGLAIVTTPDFHRAVAQGDDAHTARLITRAVFDPANRQ